MSTTTAEQRRARIAEAVWRIIADRGVTAVSVRTVAAEADLAVGSLRHLFPTKSGLLAFAAESMVERATARIGAVVHGERAIVDAMAALSEIMPLRADTRREFEVNLALIAETPAHPELAGIRNRAHDDLLELCARIVRALAPAADDDTVRSRARRLLALVDGLGLHLLHRPAAEDPAWATEIIRLELERLDDPPRTSHHRRDDDR